MYPRDNIFKIYYQIGRALPFEVRRFPDGRVSDWYKSQSVIVTKIHPRKEYGDAWGYYYRNGKREASYWCKKADSEPQAIPCCGCGGWVLVDVIGQPTVEPEKPIEELKYDPYIKLLPDSVLSFGKYKGKTIAEVYQDNPSYLVWAENNISDFWVDWGKLKQLYHGVSIDVANNQI